MWKKLLLVVAKVRSKNLYDMPKCIIINPYEKTKE
jgi:hypothetical protein